jgi:pSer/pThr/pTyr-binding forkhead associated (FHA) protein
MHDQAHNTGLDLAELPVDVITPRISAPGDGPERTCLLNRYVTLVGGRQDCHLHINHLDVSKIHCAFVQTGAALVLVDLCSRFGTFVNEQRIKTVAIRPGDKVRVGPAEVIVHWPANAPPHVKPTITPCPLSLRSDTDRPLNELPAVLGRRSGCHVQLDTPDVSLAHALIFAFRGRPAIFDLGSRSGTIVNGERLTSTWLRDGDALTIGGERLYVVCSMVGARSAAPDPNAETVAGLAIDPATADKLVRQVKSGIASLSERVAARANAIKQREQAIDSRAASVAEMRSEAETRGRANEEREAKLSRRERSVLKAEERLKRRHQSLTKGRAKLRAAAVGLRAERKRLTGELEQLAADREALAGQRQAVESDRLALKEQLAAGEVQREQLGELERRLKEARARIEEQELREHVMAEKMQMFQRALEEVSQAFSEQDPEDESDANEPGPSGAAGGSANGPANNRHAIGSNGDRGASQANVGATATGQRLPGPIVDQPMFVPVQEEAPGPSDQSPKPTRRRWWS